MAEAVELQIAFAIELLTMAPVRCRNLASIRLDRNIIDNGAGRQRRVHLFFLARTSRTRPSSNSS